MQRQRHKLPPGTRVVVRRILGAVIMNIPCSRRREGIFAEDTRTDVLRIDESHTDFHVLDI